MLPIIHASAFELGVVELETEWFDQMQRGVGRGAETGDISGVRRDFRFEQDDVH
jgi:hypothetical protein